MDVKCNNLSSIDPNWRITILEETLEPYIKIIRSNHYQYMELRPLKLRKTVGNRVSWAYQPVWHKDAINYVWVIQMRSFKFLIKLDS